MEPTHSALIIAVPEAEPAVGAHRARLDRSSSWGVPAHVTVFFPFLPPDRIDGPALTALAEIAADVPAFDFELTHVGWFGTSVVWLAPTPDEPFRQLTEAVGAAFPQVRPYDGAFDEVVPHLTVGDGHPVAELSAAATATAAHLPVRAHATELRLINGRREPGSGWPARAAFSLGR